MKKLLCFLLFTISLHASCDYWLEEQEIVMKRLIISLQDGDTKNIVHFCDQYKFISLFATTECEIDSLNEAREEVLKTCKKF